MGRCASRLRKGLEKERVFWAKESLRKGYQKMEVYREFLLKGLYHGLFQGITLHTPKILLSNIGLEVNRVKDFWHLTVFAHVAHIPSILAQMISQGFFIGYCF